MSFPNVGDKAPDFTITTDTNETITLSDFRGQWVILYFYPKSDTPGCTAQACAFRDNYELFKQKGVVVLGASPDTETEQAAFKAKYKLPFILLADANHTIAEQYGIWADHRIERDERVIEFTGIRRSTLIIDPDGIVRHALWGVDAANNANEVLNLLD